MRHSMPHSGQLQSQLYQQHRRRGHCNATDAGSAAWAELGGRRDRYIAFGIWRRVQCNATDVGSAAWAELGGLRDGYIALGFLRTTGDASDSRVMARLEEDGGMRAVETTSGRAPEQEGVRTNQRTASRGERRFFSKRWSATAGHWKSKRILTRRSWVPAEWALTLDEGGCCRGSRAKRERVVYIL